MYSYSHHIGDFIKHTARLSDSQSMAYLRLLWIYYESEVPIDNDIEAIAFKIGASPIDVLQILKHFFTLELTENKWHNSRVDKELSIYHARSAASKSKANKRWSNAVASKNDATALQQHNDEPTKITPEFDENAYKLSKHVDARNCNNNATAMPQHQKNNENDATALQQHQKNGENDANREPITDNRYINTKEKKIKEKNQLIPDIPKILYEDFVKLRKAKNSPLTKTAIDGIRREAETAGITLEAAITVCVERSWQGFKAEWYENQKKNNSPVSLQSFAQSDQAAKRKAWEQMTGENWPEDSEPSNNFNFIDVQTTEILRIQA